MLILNQLSIFRKIPINAKDAKIIIGNTKDVQQTKNVIDVMKKDIEVLFAIILPIFITYHMNVDVSNGVLNIKGNYQQQNIVHIVVCVINQRRFMKCKFQKTRREQDVMNVEIKTKERIIMNRTKDKLHHLFHLNQTRRICTKN